MSAQKRSSDYNSYGGIIFSMYNVSLLAGIAFHVQRTLVPVFIALGLAGIVLFMLTVNKSSELKEGLSRPSFYIIGFVLLCSTSFIAGFFIPSTIGITFAFISLGGVVFLLRAINREVLKNTANLDEEES